MRLLAPILICSVIAAGCAVEPTLLGSEWDGTTRDCGDPVNDVEGLILVVNDDGFARIATFLGWPADQLGAQCDGLQAPVDERLDFSETLACPTFTISYDVDVQDDALEVGANGAIVTGSVTFLRDDGLTDTCGIQARRRRLAGE